MVVFLKLRTSTAPVTLAYNFTSSTTHLPTPTPFPPSQHSIPAPSVIGTSFPIFTPLVSPIPQKAPAPGNQSYYHRLTYIYIYIHSYSSQDRRVAGDRIITSIPRTLRGESTVDPPYEQVMHL